MENTKCGEILFIPHHLSVNLTDWKILCEKVGFVFVNPRGESKEIIRKIKKAKLVIAEAMHAAIIADAMRVNWIPVVISDNINTFKWLDFLSVLGIPYKPVYLGLPSRFYELFQKVRISQGLSWYKPEFKSMKITDLLDTSGKYVKVWKVRKIYKLLNKLAQNIHEKRIVFPTASYVEKFSQLPEGESFLSRDDIWEDNFNKMKNKLDELKSKLNLK